MAAKCQALDLCKLGRAPRLGALWLSIRRALQYLPRMVRTERTR
jgi:hypothetical protein